MQTNSYFKDAVSGGVIASLEVTFPGQLFVRAKNHVQNNPGKSFRELLTTAPRSPKELYRGFTPHCALSGVATSVTYVAFQALKERTESTATSAFFAGIVTALIASPMELTLITQGTLQCGIGAAVSRVWKSAYRGFIFVAPRDALFTMGFKWLAPNLRGKLEECGVRKTPAVLAAGVAAGILSGIATQPFDTLSTIVKAALTDPKLEKTGRAYIANQGLLATYRGGYFRWALRVPCAVVIYTLWDSLKFH